MSNKLFIFRGLPGFDGIDGINGLGPAEVQYSPASDPLYNVLNSNNLSKVGNIEFDRASIATGIDRHQKYITSGDFTVTNFIKDSEDFTAWSISGSRATIIGSTTDPFGGSDATEINLDVETIAETGFAPVFITTPDVTKTANQDSGISIYAKLISGSAPRIEYQIGSDNFVWGDLTGSWQRFETTQVLANTAQLFGVNPKGSIGARIALYAVQLEDSHTVTDYIKTSGAKAGRAETSNFERESNLGWLIEEEKENKLSFSGNLEEWTLLNCTVERYSGLDPFGLTNQFIKVVWASIVEVSLTEDLVGSITPGQEYTVSFWAFLAGGSLFNMNVSVGGGTAVDMPTVSTEGFERISVTCTAGVTTDFVITATSNNLTANLNISGVQVETVGLTSYIRTDSLALTREPDIVTAPYQYNIPAPNLPWSFIFSHNSVLNTVAQKTVFTNNQTAGDEFACYFKNGNFIVKNGSTEVSVPGLNFIQIVVTWDETNIRIYNGRTLISTTAITPSTFIPTTLYIGMDGSEADALNGQLGNFMFFDVKLTDDEIIYLTGV